MGEGSQWGWNMEERELGRGELYCSVGESYEEGSQDRGRLSQRGARGEKGGGERQGRGELRECVEVRRGAINKFPVFTYNTVHMCNVYARKVFVL
jgi:hypothetical protein